MIIIIVRVFENDNQYHKCILKIIINIIMISVKKCPSKSHSSNGHKMSIEKVYLPMGDTLTHAISMAVFRDM